MASGVSPEWREWKPLTGLLEQLPHKYQQGIQTHNLDLTCLAYIPHHLILGTNVGLVYLAHLPTLNIVRLKCEKQEIAITTVSGVSTVDDMIAAGSSDGTITIFQLPRIPNIQNKRHTTTYAGPFEPKATSATQPTIKRFTVASTCVHSGKITSLAWSRNGMKLFSGDERGVVSVTDINYQTSECTARELLREDAAITQLSYSYQLLALSTTERALVYDTSEGTIQQVGQKPRKYSGMFGCMWSPAPSRMTSILYTSRPGLRLWSADMKGEVMQTHIIKEFPERAQIYLLNPKVVEQPRDKQIFSFGLLHILNTSHVVSHNSSWLFVIDVENLKVTNYSGQFRNIIDLGVSENEIFVLDGPRSITCLSTEPSNIGEKKVVSERSNFPEAHNLKVLGSRIVSQGSGFLGQIARMGSSVAARVSEHASPLIMNGQNSKHSPHLQPKHKVPQQNPNVFSDWEQGHQRSSSSGSIPAPNQQSSPSTIPPRMAQSVSSLFPSLLSAQSIVKSYGKAPALHDGTNPGEFEVIEDLEEIVTSYQIVAQDTADNEPLVLKDKAKKKAKKKIDPSPSPDTVSVCSYKSAISDASYSTPNEIPSSPSVVPSHCSTSSPSTEPDELNACLEISSIEKSQCNDDLCTQSPGAEGVLGGEGEMPESQTADGFDGEGVLYGERRTEALNEEKEGLDDVDTRTYDDFKTDIQKKESLLAEILDLGCLKMDHEVKSDEVASLSSNELRFNYLTLDRTISNESTECSTPSTLKEQSPLPDTPSVGGNDFYSQFYPDNTSLTSLDSNIPSTCKKRTNSVGDGQCDDQSLSGNDGGERIPSNTSEDRQSCLSYGPPSGSSLLSLPGYKVTQDQTNNESRAVLTVIDSSDVADISWSYAASSTHEIHEYEREEMTGGWVKHKLPSNLVSVSVSENNVAFLDSHGCLYIKDFDGGYHSWRKIRLNPKATNISLSPNGYVLCFVCDGTAYSITTPTEGTLPPSSMVPVAQNIRQICVDEELTWYLKENGQVSVQPNLRSKSQGLISCNDFRLIKVVSFARVVWGLTDKGDVLFRIGITAGSVLGQEWGLIKSHGGIPVRDVALGPGQKGWIVDAKGRVFFRPGVCQEHPQGHHSIWWQVATSDYMLENCSSVQGNVMLSLSSKGLFLAEREAVIFFSHDSDITGHAWATFTEDMWSTVCAEGVYNDHGAVCCLSPQGHLFIVNPITACCVPMELVNKECVVSVSQRPETLWVLTATGDIYIRMGLSAKSLHGSHWEQLDLHQIGDIHLCHISCGTEVVWGVDTSGGVYMRQGTLTPPSVNSLPPAWIQVDPTPLKGNAVFTKVYVGIKLHVVWAIDSSRRVYVREAIFPELPIGTSWVPVPGLQALQLTISECEVYALTPSGEVYQRLGVTEINYIGDTWEKIPGNLARISVTSDNRLWGLNLCGQLCQHGTLSANLPRSKLPGHHEDSHELSLSSEHDDWEKL